MSMEMWLGAPLIGFIGMMSGGYWGVGCGWIVVPVMLIFGFSPLESVGIGLLQMIPATLPTVIRHTPQIGWRPHELGWRLVVPLGVGAALTSLCGKSINSWLFAHFGDKPLDCMFAVFILGIAVQTLCSRTGAYNDVVPLVTKRMRNAAVGIGMATGLLSSLLGVGGGILIRPTLTSIFKIPELYTSRIVRLLVLVTTVIGGATYLVGTNNFSWRILGMATLVAAGGMLGFPLGVKMHLIVYNGGYAQHIHKSFAVIALALLVNTMLHLAGKTELCRWVMPVIGGGLMFYLVAFTLYARRYPVATQYATVK